MVGKLFCSSFCTLNKSNSTENRRRNCKKNSERKQEKRGINYETSNKGHDESGKTRCFFIFLPCHMSRLCIMSKTISTIIRRIMGLHLLRWRLMGVGMGLGKRVCKIFQASSAFSTKLCLTRQHYSAIWTNQMKHLLQ